MSAAEVDRHNRAELWSDVVLHLEAAENSLDNAFGALEDLTNVYGDEHALDDEASRLHSAVESLLRDAKHAQSAAKR